MYPREQRMTGPAAYAAGASRNDVEQALRAAGKDPAALAPDDLAELEDFHTGGRLATAQLAELAGIGRRDRVLDAGSGIGGTARYLAASRGCTVTAIDQSEQYCATARWLNEIVGLDDRITVTKGDVTALPCADTSFDVVFSQHVQMNVGDKAALYREAYRVLRPGGRLACWDIAGAAPDDAFPLPWATDPAESHLAGSDDLREHVTAAGFRIERWNDLTAPIAELMAGFLSQPQSPLGLQVYVPDFATKAGNLVRGLAEGWLRAIQGLAVRPVAGAAG